MDGTTCRIGSPIPAVALPVRRRAVSNALTAAVESMLAWHERTKSRRALLGLDDRMLKDIGIDRATAHIEGIQPFWKR